MIDNIQMLINSGKSEIILPPGEYKGTYIIDHPCTIEGKNTTIWNNTGSVIKINSDGVILKNLRIENNSYDKNIGFAIETAYPTSLFDVEIFGLTKGFGNEDQITEMNRQIPLGKFKSEEENTFLFEIFVSEKSIIETDIKDIEIIPNEINQGLNKIKIKLCPLPADSYIYGDIIIKSTFTRRYYLSGISNKNADICIDKQINNIDNIPDIINVIAFNTHQQKSVQSVSSKVAPVISTKIQNNEKKYPDRNNGVHILRRGERININEYANNTFTIKMGYKGLYKPMDIDPYAFMLDASGITSCDDDFVYFGNTKTPSGAITFNEDKSIDLVLSRIPSHINRVSFVYSIYQPGTNDNFSKVKEPYISIVQNGQEIIRYTAEELFAETTIIFLDIYKHLSGWKLNTIGQGYREGLKKLCSSYGLIVS